VKFPAREYVYAYGVTNDVPLYQMVLFPVPCKLKLYAVILAATVEVLVNKTVCETCPNNPVRLTVNDALGSSAASAAGMRNPTRRTKIRTLFISFMIRLP
jgi:hypothetical protein